MYLHDWHFHRFTKMYMLDRQQLKSGPFLFQMSPVSPAPTLHQSLHAVVKKKKTSISDKCSTQTVAQAVISVVHLHKAESIIQQWVHDEQWDEEKDQLRYTCSSVYMMGDIGHIIVRCSITLVHAGDAKPMKALDRVR